MRKIFFLSLLIFSFISCKNKESTENIIREEHQPLFIGLSPKMTDNEFEEEISNLNHEKKLDSGDFIIPINNKTYKFKVSKTGKTVRLLCTEYHTMYVKNFDINIAEERISDAETIISEIIKIFEEKYGDSKIRFPVGAPFLDYKMNSEYYNIYQDSYKTVLMGYDIYDTRDPTPSSEERFADVAVDGENSKREIDHGFRVIIDYYYNEDFDKLFKSIELKTKNNDQKWENKLKRDAENRKRDADNLKNNLKKL